MPLRELTRPGPGTAQWDAWGTTARVVVTDPSRIESAKALVEEHMAAVDLACSRFRPDSEVRRLEEAHGTTVTVSPLLADLVGTALTAAATTSGDVDPTVGSALRRLGYDRDIRLVTTAGRTTTEPVPGWREIRLDGDRLTVPDGILLDLGATAKARAADHCARLVADRLGVGVLVGLGGDIATAGPTHTASSAGGRPPGTPRNTWGVLVQDGPDEPAAPIRMPSGTAVASSSTISRRWGGMLHHILDPRTCQPAPPVWRTVSVVADSCVRANTLSTAAIVRGRAALRWLRDLGAPTRLVAADRTVVRLNGWPA